MHCMWHQGCALKKDMEKNEIIIISSLNRKQRNLEEFLFIFIIWNISHCIDKEESTHQENLWNSSPMCQYILASLCMLKENQSIIQLRNMIQCWGLFLAHCFQFKNFHFILIQQFEDQKQNITFMLNFIIDAIKYLS